MPTVVYWGITMKNAGIVSMMMKKIKWGDFILANNGRNRGREREDMARLRPVNE